MKKLIIILTLVVSAINVVDAQKIAGKTNFLYGIGTLTPNLGVELGLGKRSTLDIGAGYNPWNLAGSFENNKKLVHFMGQVEYRHWFCKRFTGHFIGAHALGTTFNISGYELPLLFEKGSKDFRYEGFGYGGGISYGYNFYLGKRWSLEATLGLGWIRMHFDKYVCVKCGSKLEPVVKDYYGPTRAGVSLIYYFK